MVNCLYKLTVAVGISFLFQPGIAQKVNYIELGGCLDSFLLPNVVEDRHKHWAGLYEYLDEIFFYLDFMDTKEREALIREMRVQLDSCKMRVVEAYPDLCVLPYPAYQELFLGLRFCIGLIEGQLVFMMTERESKLYSLLYKEKYKPRHPLCDFKEFPFKSTSRVDTSFLKFNMTHRQLEDFIRYSKDPPDSILLENGLPRGED